MEISCSHFEEQYIITLYFIIDSKSSFTKKQKLEDNSY